MATRTVSTGDDVEAALAFLAKQANKSSDDLLMEQLGSLFAKNLAQADEVRFKMVNDLLSSEKDKGVAISKLRELLGV